MSTANICYTYLIGWSSANKWYYGRRTAKNCHPEEFWVSYKTSSKEVKNFILLHGDPDIKQIRKTFKTADHCKSFESRVLKKLKVSTNNKWLNLKEGDSKWDTTGTVVVRDAQNKKFSVHVNDPRYVSGELVCWSKGRKQKSKNKNTVVVKDHKGKHFRISKDSQEYIDGKYVVSSTGYVPVKDMNGNMFRVLKDDPRYLSGELEHTSKGIPNVKCKNKVTVRDRHGTCFNVSSKDERYLSGELVPASKGIPKSTVTYRGKDPVISCPYCGTTGGHRIIKRWHFNNCKLCPI